jgi:class 3 adenylate cyclase
MPGLSPSEIAARAGLDSAFVEELARLGLIEPYEDNGFSEGDVQRARILQTLEGAGLPLPGLGEAIRRGVLTLDFMDIDTYDRWASLSDTTYRELGEATGLPLELLTVIREAMGYAQPMPDDRMREDEKAVLPLITIQHDYGFRPAVIERALRVIGESMRRVAETESDWWREEVMMPLIRAGEGPDVVAKVSKELSPPMAKASDQAIVAIYHGQQANAWIRNILEGLENALQNAGLHEPPERVPAICFLDLTGYTRLTEERGDEAAADLARNLSTMVQQQSRSHGGKAIKWLGDGVMFHFPEPAQGVVAALDMVEAAPRLGVESAHVGLHAGPVLFQEGDYFGRTVNIASRIADYARPGEVVVSQEVVAAANHPSLAFTEIGPVELKGVAGAMRLSSAHRLA